MTGPRCGNDSCRGGIKRFLPFASGQVLPLPSSASRGIGGCHLPPLGEGRAVADSPDVAACLWCCCAARRGRRALQRSVADSSGFCGRPRRPHPFPPPAGEGAAHKGGRRGRTRRDRTVEMTAAGGKATILPLANGHVLPLPSSASRGIGGCHLPPLGEGRGGCEFAGRCGLSLVLLPGRRDAAPYNEMLQIRLAVPFIHSALTLSLPQRGRVSPTRATGEGERDWTAMWK